MAKQEKLKLPKPPKPNFEKICEICGNEIDPEPFYWKFLRFISKLLIVVLLVWLGWSAHSIVVPNGPIKDIPAPADIIAESQIHVLPDKIILDIKDAKWGKFADSNSMIPVLDEGHNSIEITPKDPKEIQVGDIISYNNPYANGIIIHRVIGINYDEEGWYAVVKGDNLNFPDPGKVRFYQVDSIVVALIY